MSTGKTPHVHEGRDPGDAHTNQRTPKMSANHPQPGEKRGAGSPSAPSGEASPTDTLISNILAFRTMRQYIADV